MKVTGECQCAERCGRRAEFNGPPGVMYSGACHRRWKNAGRPPGGPPPAQKQPVTGVCECAAWCGRTAARHGPGGMVLSKSCQQRWVNTGKPEVVPPAARKAAVEPPPEGPPAAEMEGVLERDYCGEWAIADPVLRGKLAAPVAADLVRCVRARDRQDVEILMSRFTDWGALAVVLAGWVDPVKARNAA